MTEERKKNDPYISLARIHFDTFLDHFDALIGQRFINLCWGYIEKSAKHFILQGLSFFTTQ